jgi:hypothetical protein
VECLETLVPSLARATLEPEQPDEASA